MENHITKQSAERISLNASIVNGGADSNATLLAMNDIAHKKQANRSPKWVSIITR